MDKNCTLCFHNAVCYAMGRRPERAETCTEYAPNVTNVIYGEWKATIVEQTETMVRTGGPHCNLCGGISARRTPYCPNCGAKMKGE